MNRTGKIFLLDDDKLISSMLARSLESEGHRVHKETTTVDIFNKIDSYSPDILLLDIKLPDMNGIEILKELMRSKNKTQVVMLTSDDTAETSVKAMKLGAVDYITKPFDIDEVKIVLQSILEKEKLKDEVGYYRERYAEKFGKTIIGKSKALQDVLSVVNDVAKANVSTVLFTGESGTGKEIFARHFHNEMYKQRNESAPFVWVNCAALPEALLETELFGYVKGAFTDAKADKKGLFELADGGSILLDEIGEMKLDLQSKLLRVLEERTIRRIAGNEDIPIDVNVIATTNQDLKQGVEMKNFRLDLFYRLNTFCVHLPPLRDREDDVLDLANHFLTQFAQKYNKKNVKMFSRQAEDILRSYSWPGNVRELRNIIERVVVLKNTETIEPEHLPAEIVNGQGIDIFNHNNRFVLPDNGINLEELEKDLIDQALQKTNNNKAQAAKLLGMSYDSLRYHVKKMV